jgi:hypothetical protein
MGCLGLCRLLVGAVGAVYSVGRAANHQQAILLPGHGPPLQEEGFTLALPLSYRYPRPLTLLLHPLPTAAAPALQVATLSQQLRAARGEIEDLRFELKRALQLAAS